MIKFVVVAACVFVYVQALTDEKKEKLKSYSAECAKTTGIDQETIDNARKGVFADNEKLKSQILCMTKKLKIQNEAGELQRDVMKAKISEELDAKVAETLIEKCAVQKDSPENTAFEAAKCFYANNPQHSVRVV